MFCVGHLSKCAVLVTCQNVPFWLPVKMCHFGYLSKCAVLVTCQNVLCWLPVQICRVGYLSKYAVLVTCQNMPCWLPVEICCFGYLSKYACWLPVKICRICYLFTVDSLDRFLRHLIPGFLFHVPTFLAYFTCMGKNKCRLKSLSFKLVTTIND